MNGNCKVFKRLLLSLFYPKYQLAAFKVFDMLHQERLWLLVACNLYIPND